mmetsp:Transcript_4325/g.19502  ORF Transcript_4325/g.19502 Transcript_4325/m.19502 type:complete len:302 (-) Transcript_4325:1259-2164(-)
MIIFEDEGAASTASGSLSTHKMCHSESRRHATKFGNSLAGKGRPSLNSSSSPVSKNVPYASAKTPNDSTHASFIDRVEPKLFTPPPPTSGHALRDCNRPSTDQAPGTNPPNANDRITSPRSDARSRADAALTRLATVLKPSSAASAGPNADAAVDAADPKAGTPPEEPKAGAGKVASGHAPSPGNAACTNALYVSAARKDASWRVTSRRNGGYDVAWVVCEECLAARRRRAARCSASSSSSEGYSSSSLTSSPKSIRVGSSSPLVSSPTPRIDAPGGSLSSSADVTAAKRTAIFHRPSGLD